MSNIVLYRKYRPKSFAEVIGQEHVIKTLTNAIANGMISHAYLFAGPRGSGKTTVARLFAKAVNCENIQGYEPCNKCFPCREINENRAIDIMEIDAASHRGIDEIRELKEGVRFVPTRLKYKVFIIDESHQLTKEAANALLKTLEEPPSHVIFILATTEVHKMIPTIISRCQHFDFRRLSLDEIVQRLGIIAKAENADIAKETFEMIAIHSGGSSRDAESILDQVMTFSQGSGKKKIEPEDVRQLLGLAETGTVSRFVDFVLEKDTAGALGFITEITEKGYDLEEFTSSLIGYLRQGLITKINPQIFNAIIAGLTEEEFKNLKKQISQVQEKELSKMLEIFLDAENKMRYSSLPQLPLELAVVSLLQKPEK